jgi:CheY-like chemotaxis protein
MPVMDGLEAAGKIAELGINTPVVAITANIMTNDLELYINNGMKDYIGKPFTSQELWKFLTKYLQPVNYDEVDNKMEDMELEKAYKRLLSYFYNHNKTTFEDIKKAAYQGDLKVAHRLTHSLKGNAGQIRKKRLQEAAIAAEVMFLGGILPFDERKMNTLETELKHVMDEIEPIVSQQEEIEKLDQTDKESVWEIINKLEPMLIDNSTECMNIVDLIQTIPGAEDLAKYTEEFEFEQALIELNKLKKGWYE